MRRRDTESIIRTLRATGAYHSPPGDGAYRPRLPLRYYLQVGRQVVAAARRPAAGEPAHAPLMHASLGVIRVIEELGGSVHVTGADALAGTEGGIVVISNHMSTLETFLLPGLVLPFKPLTFVLKESLLKYPFLGRVLRNLTPITVGRKDPKRDLARVMSLGCEHLRDGRSVIVFPQSTRTPDFNPRRFNSLGVKLALRAGAAVIPAAVKTDLWGNGRLIKDLGPIDMAKPVHIEFGAVDTSAGSAKAAQADVVAFISKRLDTWRTADGVKTNRPPA